MESKKVENLILGFLSVVLLFLCTYGWIRYFSAGITLQEFRLPWVVESASFTFDGKSLWLLSVAFLFFAGAKTQAPDLKKPLFSILIGFVGFLFLTATTSVLIWSCGYFLILLAALGLVNLGETKSNGWYLQNRVLVLILLLAASSVLGSVSKEAQTVAAYLVFLSTPVIFRLIPFSFNTENQRFNWSLLEKTIHHYLPALGWAFFVMRLSPRLNWTYEKDIVSAVLLFLASITTLRVIIQRKDEVDALSLFSSLLVLPVILAFYVSENTAHLFFMGCVSLVLIYEVLSLGKKSKRLLPYLVLATLFLPISSLGASLVALTEELIQSPQILWPALGVFTLIVAGLLIRIDRKAGEKSEPLHWVVASVCFLLSTTYFIAAMPWLPFFDLSASWSEHNLLSIKPWTGFNIVSVLAAPGAYLLMLLIAELRTSSLKSKPLKFSLYSSSPSWIQRATDTTSSAIANANEWGIENLLKKILLSALEKVTTLCASFLNGIDQWIYHHLQKLGGRVVEGAGRALLSIQSGDIQWYTIFGVGSVILILVHFLLNEHP